MSMFLYSIMVAKITIRIENCKCKRIFIFESTIFAKVVNLFRWGSPPFP